MNDPFSEQVEVKDFESALVLVKESRTAFEQLFNNSPACMSLTNLDRVFVKVNRKFLEKFGLEETEVIGRNSAQIGILDKEEMEKVSSILKEKGMLQNDFVTCRAKDGRLVYTVSSIERMEFNGQLYLLSTFLDITERREAEEQLRIVNSDLDSFSYSVSHDLRAPLRAIQGYVQMLEEDYGSKLDEEGKRLIGVVNMNSVKMGNLIEGLLEFSRLGRKAIQKEEINMNGMVKEIIAVIKQSDKVKTEFMIKDLHVAKGSFDLLNHVMVNLISNAVKYSSKKENPIVTISSESKDGQVVFSVQDNGAGFDMSYADKLFGVFQRLHKQAEFEGTGVGLSIVQRIIKNHGGKVWAEAKVNEGATFYFSLPEN